MPIWNQKGVYDGVRPNVIFPVTSGLVLFLDAGNSASYPVKNFVSAKIYSTYNGGLRSSNYTVQYSDDNSTWTTAFSGVATNNTSCGIQQNTGVGSGSYGAHRYWRYVEGSAIASHHPRVSRIILTDINGNDYPFITYTTDNCSDTGTYIVGTVSVDVGGTTWTDLSGLNNNATLFNSPTWSSTNGGTFTFNGSNQYAALASGALQNFNSGITIFTIVNMGTGSNYERIIDFGSGAPSNNIILYRIGTSTTLALYIANGTTTTVDLQVAGGITNSTIACYAATANGTNIKLYRNTSEIGTQVNSNLPVNTSRTNNYIGRSNWAADAYFESAMYVIMFYNRALSAAEITQNYNFFKDRYGL